MTNIPYEERIKNRSNEWYYYKCIRQYHFIIKSEGANRRYKEEIARLNKIIEEALYYLEIDMIGTAIDKLKELKEEGKKDE